MNDKGPSTLRRDGGLNSLKSGWCLVAGSASGGMGGTSSEDALLPLMVPRLCPGKCLLQILTFTLRRGAQRMPAEGGAVRGVLPT